MNSSDLNQKNLQSSGSYRHRYTERRAVRLSSPFSQSACVHASYHIILSSRAGVFLLAAGVSIPFLACPVGWVCAVLRTAGFALLGTWIWDDRGGAPHVKVGVVFTVQASEVEVRFRI